MINKLLTILKSKVADKRPRVIAEELGITVEQVNTLIADLNKRGYILTSGPIITSGGCHSGSCGSCNIASKCSINPIDTEDQIILPIGVRS